MSVAPPLRPSLHALGQSNLALVPGHGLIYLLDAAASAIAHALDQGEPEAAVAELLARGTQLDPAEARRQVARIQALLWPPAAPAAARFAGALRWRPAAPRPAPCHGGCSFRVLNSVLCCRFADAALRHAATAAFAPLLAPPGAAATASFDIGRDGAGVYIARGAEVLDEPVAPAALLNALRLLLTETALAASGAGWAVHAAAVAVGTRAVLLPGAPGRGKSTLALHCAAAGLTLFSDDTLVLAEDFALRALPFPLCLKPGAWPLAEGLLAAPHRVIAGRRADGLAVRWLPPACGLRFAPPDARAQVGAVVLPQFVAAAPCRLEPLAEEAALRELLPGLSPLGGTLTAARVEALLAWLRGRPVFALRYGEAAAAVAAVRAVLAG